MNQLRVVWNTGISQDFYYDEIYHRETYILLISGGKEYILSLFNIKYTEQL